MGKRVPYQIGNSRNAAISESFKLNWMIYKLTLRKIAAPKISLTCTFESYFSNLYRSKFNAQSLPKRDVFMKLPFLRSSSFQTRNNLSKLL